MHDLAVIIVSIPTQPHWLGPALRSVYARAGDVSLDVVVADNGSAAARDLVEHQFTEARVVRCENRGFAYANNRALMTCDARYILFLNPDTEILDGTLSELVAALDERPLVGLAGVRQVSQAGAVYPTIRRFPNALRAFGEALGSERLPIRSRHLGERELDLRLYDAEVACDWVSGSFMLVRREALEGAGYMDERCFMYTEEPDLCRRIKRGGWEIRHLPLMTIFHNTDKVSIDPRTGAQAAFAWKQYARKHFSPLHRLAFQTALALRYALRSVVSSGADGERRRERRASARRALGVVLGFESAPFALPPPVAVMSRSSDGGDGVSVGA